MKKFKLIVPSFIALIFCMLLIAGSTFALFTSEAKANISVTSGKVKIEAGLDELKLYSANAVELATYNAAEANDKAGQITEGNYAGNYLFALQNGQFANGGTATLTGGSLAVEKMTPGDKVVAKLEIDNQSNVNIKYRVVMTTSYTFGTGENAHTYPQTLASALKVTIDETQKQGLVSYQSAWIELDNGADPASALDFVLEFPLEAGNDYQEGGVIYNFLVEAVQANAATSGSELFDTIDLYVPARSAKTTMEESTETVIAVKDNEADAQPRVEVTIPAALATSEKEVELKVSDLFVEKVESTADSKVSMKIDLKLDGQAVTQENPLSQNVTVKIFVGKGLNTVKLYHDNDPVDENDYSYSSSTGYITYTTNHFSPFRIEGDFVAAVTVGNNAPVLFSKWDGEDGIYQIYQDNASTSNVTIDLFADFNFTSVVILDKSVTINGNGHTINSSANRVFRISNGNITVNMNDLAMISTWSDDDSRVISIDSNFQFINLNLTACSLKCGYYALNLTGKNGSGSRDVTININKCTLEGYAAINNHANTTTITVNDSILIGNNDKQLNSWNNFGTIVFDGSNLFADGSTSYGSIITVNNSIICQISKYGNYQAAFSSQYGNVNSEAHFNNVTVQSKGENTQYFLYPYKKTNNVKVYFDGELYYEGYEVTE